MTDQPLTDAERTLPPHLGELTIVATARAIAAALVWSFCCAAIDAAGMLAAPVLCRYYQGRVGLIQYRSWLVGIFAIQFTTLLSICGARLMLGSKVSNMEQLPIRANTGTPPNTRLWRLLHGHYTAVGGIYLVLRVAGKSEIIAPVIGFIAVNMINAFRIGKRSPDHTAHNNPMHTYRCIVDMAVGISLGI